MPIYYRGAGIGTYWHGRDATRTGFKAKSISLYPSFDRIALHIARGDINSPFLSLTASYGVAYDYAFFGQAAPTKSRPAYVYEIEFPERRSKTLELVDPVPRLAERGPKLPQRNTYHHDGDMNFLLGVIKPEEFGDFLANPVRQPPLGTGTKRAANLSLELEAIVRAIRDAEILAVGEIPKRYVQTRHAIW